MSNGILSLSLDVIYLNPKVLERRIRVWKSNKELLRLCCCCGFLSELCRGSDAVTFLCEMDFCFRCLQMTQIAITTRATSINPRPHPATITTSLFDSTQPVPASPMTTSSFVSFCSEFEFDWFVSSDGLRNGAPRGSFKLQVVSIMIRPRLSRLDLLPRALIPIIW